MDPLNGWSDQTKNSCIVLFVSTFNDIYTYKSTVLDCNTQFTEYSTKIVSWTENIYDGTHTANHSSMSRRITKTSATYNWKI